MEKESKMFVTFGVFGEYDDYFGMALTSNELETIEKFMSALNSNAGNVSIKITKVESVL